MQTKFSEGVKWQSTSMPFCFASLRIASFIVNPTVKKHLSVGVLLPSLYTVLCSVSGLARIGYALAVIKTSSSGGLVGLVGVWFIDGEP